MTTHCAPERDTPGKRAGHARLGAAAQADPAGAAAPRHLAVSVRIAPAAHRGAGPGGGTGDPPSQRRA